jgi:hypothetical protein
LGERRLKTAEYTAFNFVEARNDKLALINIVVKEGGRV